MKRYRQVLKGTFSAEIWKKTGLKASKGRAGQCQVIAVSVGCMPFPWEKIALEHLSLYRYLCNITPLLQYLTSLKTIIYP